MVEPQKLSAMGRDVLKSNFKLHHIKPPGDYFFPAIDMFVSRSVALNRIWTSDKELLLIDPVCYLLQVILRSNDANSSH